MKRWGSAWIIFSMNNERNGKRIRKDKSCLNRCDAGIGMRGYSWLMCAWFYFHSAEWAICPYRWHRSI